MKHRKIAITAIAVGIGVLFSIIWCIRFYFQSEKKIPLFEAVEFGMSYSDLCAQYGSAVSVIENYCETEHTAYFYELTLFENTAEVCFQFYMDKMDRVDLIWEHTLAEDASETYFRTKDRLIEALGWRFDFHVKADTHTASSVELAFLRNSGRSIRYDLSLKDTKVHVICRSTK